MAHATPPTPVREPEPSVPEAAPAAGEAVHSLDPFTAQFDFQGDQFDLSAPEDREIISFLLSQALYGEATGVYCGKSLYAAGSLEAARFYVRQARQELNHLELFAAIFRDLDLTPTKGHWVVRLLSAHNNYYPLKVLMEHAIGEGMVLDIFRDVLLQTLPESDPRVPRILKKLRAVCREEVEHVAWGEKETKRLLAEKPWLRVPYYGLIELQLMVAPFIARGMARRYPTHRVMRHLPRFVDHIVRRVRVQGEELGIVPAERPGFGARLWAMTAGVALFLRSQLARGSSRMEHIYLQELGFSG